jgi:protein-arginine deiminase
VRTLPRSRWSRRRSVNLSISGAMVLALLPAGAANADDPVPPDLDAVCAGDAATFPDVPAASSHLDAIRCLQDLGVAQGFTDGTYRPRTSVTRDQMATFIAKTVAQARALPDGGGSFADIEGNVHAEAIRQLAAAGIVLGRDETTFAPRETVTRDQMASFITRALSYLVTGDADGLADMPEGVGTTFPDVPADNAHALSIAALAGWGVVSGFEDGTFGPRQQVLRDQMATFLVGGLRFGLDTAGPVVRMLADVDRDGELTAADAAGRDTWTEDRGAIMLANLDDHAERCDVVDDAGDIISDDDLALCFDAADDVVNGELDAEDLAPLRVEPVRDLPETATGTLDVGPAEYANVFVAEGDGWTLLDDDAVFDADALSAGIDLRIEATDIVRDAEVWDGLVDLHLDVVDGDEEIDGDHVVVRVAPLLFVNNTMPLEQLIIAEHPAPPPSTQRFGVPTTEPEYDILGDLLPAPDAMPDASTDAAGGQAPTAPATVADDDAPAHWPNGFADFRADLRAELDALGHPEDFIELDTGTDKWIQDMFEPAYMSMPAAGGGEHRMRIYIRTANQSRSGFREGRPLREGGRALFEKLQGPGVGVVQQYDPELLTGTNARHPQDTFNSGGNFEAAPPYLHSDGRSFPAGRMIYGARAPYQADPSFLAMLRSQGYQDPIEIDTSFLRVGHTDEVFTFLPADNERGWVVGVADARVGTQLLQDMVDDGLGDERLVNDVEELGGRVALGDLTVQEALFNSELRLGQTQGTLGVDAALAILIDELDLTEDEIVRLPALFRDPGGSTGNPPRTGLYAYLPGVANGISTGTGGFLSPKQHGPQRDGVDVFEAYTEEALGEHGIDVGWVEDWVYAHQGTGEIHCVTNAKRDLTVTQPWWDQTVAVD